MKTIHYINSLLHENTSTLTLMFQTDLNTFIKFLNYSERIFPFYV